MAAFLANPADFTKAEGIYQNGANSMKTSEITLDTPLAQAFPAGSPVKQGGKFIGRLNKPAAVGDTVIKVGTNTPCVSQYGQSPDTSGCFSDDGGNFFIDEVDVGPGTVKLKYRTLQGFSTSANDKMTGKEIFEIYKAYYGVGDYADKFITAALQATNDDETNVSMDFSGKDDDFRAECATKGSAFWSDWLYTIWEMEDAIGDCDADCAEKDCNDAPVHAWDEAWAFYTGSLEGKYGNPAGIFLYRLAEDMSKIFGTELAGKSKVNRELENAFLDGKDQIDQGKCSAAQAQKKKISRPKCLFPLSKQLSTLLLPLQMVIPLPRQKQPPPPLPDLFFRRWPNVQLLMPRLSCPTCGLMLLLWTWLGTKQSREHLKTIMLAWGSLLVMLVACELWTLD